MSNALKELFTNQANAIRSGLGDIGKIKPLDTPDLIMEIVSLIGSGTGSSGGSSGGSSSTGSLRMATGSFEAPEFSIVHPAIRMDQCTIDSRGFLRYTDTTGKCVLQSGVEYCGVWGGDQEFDTATYSSGFGTFGSCVVIGNKSLEASTAGDTDQNWLVVYEPAKGKSTVVMRPHDQDHQTFLVYDPSVNMVTQTITHGKDTMPDLVVAWVSSLNEVLASKTSIGAMWGLKSSFKSYSGVLGGFTYGTWGSSSETSGLDNGSAGKGYIYCPDDTSFVVGFENNRAVHLTPGATYKWLAMWGISGGGGSGSSADVRYVTFMNGNTVLYKKPVAVGDDCVDVLTKGLISTPTKASTTQYTYAFYGWGASDGGAADSNILKNITEDKTVYAIYTSAVRYYTITYLDDDGVTVLHTESLAYGSTPSYKPTKEGYYVESWTPAITKVTGDASYQVNWKAGYKLADYTWTEINSLVKQGKAHLFSVGDTKQLKQKKGGSGYTARIVGINHDDLADGSGKAGLTLRIECDSTKKYWNGTGGSYINANWLNANAYTGSTFAAYLNATNTNQWEAEFISALKTVTKKYYDFATSAYATANVKYFLPAMSELKAGTGAKDEGEVYAYYANGFASKLGSYNPCWTRTKTSYSGGMVYVVYQDGTYKTINQGTTEAYPTNYVCI